MTRILLACMVIATVLAGCKKEEEAPSANAIRVSVQLMDGNTPIQAGDVFQTPEGYRVRIDQLDFYLSEFAGTYAGTNLSTENEVGLIKMGNERTSADLSIATTEGLTLSAFTLGVPADINANPAPETYAVDHPLSDFSGMFWTWNSGYKFIQLEGRMDLTGTDGAELTDFLSIHTGLNENLVSVATNLTRDPECNRISYTLKVDVSQWFNAVHEIDIATDNQTHTTDNPTLAEHFTANFAASLTLE